MTMTLPSVEAGPVVLGGTLRGSLPNVEASRDAPMGWRGATMLRR
jgi:hypothetical protein